MLRQVTDRVRFLVHDVLASTKGDDVRAIKLAREVLGTANDLAGRPFCAPDELELRRAKRSSGAPVPKVTREPAPVMIYFDGNDHRTKAKVEQLLAARNISFKLLDVADDESTRSWAMTAAHAHEFPLVFIAGEPVGGLHELTQADVDGTLKKRVFG